MPNSKPFHSKMNPALDIWSKYILKPKAYTHYFTCLL